MITAWQTSVLSEVPERLVRFGRLRRSITVAVLEDDRGLHVEVRLGRKLLQRIFVGDDRDALRAAIADLQVLAATEMLSTV